ncbi:MAG: Holliday junction branch migration DNA helicase RuvB [Planctomycetota bacterium]|nr:Holliday junction branch migration DNA helicase RuvB [Planctomycetota bacterium]
MSEDEDIGRQRIITAQDRGQDHDEQISVRPQTLDEYDVGQTGLIQQLRIAIGAAKQRGDVLEHVLFDGPPGLGKTTLASIIANEMGVDMHRTSGPSLERATDLVGHLTNLKRGDVFFIDEVHRLPHVVEEYMYPAMEDFCIDFVVDSGPYAKTIPLHLQPFTLIGATTRAGLLTAPLRERFGIFHHLDFYTEEQLERIVTRAARVWEIALEPGGAQELAKRSRGTARIVNRLLRRVRDYAQIMHDGTVTQEVANEALGAMSVDDRGLDDLDRRYLHAMIDYYDGGPVGLNAIAATLSQDDGTLEDVVEPYLLKIGYVGRTRQGRVVTAPAYEHLELKPPPETKSAGDEPDLFEAGEV